MPMIEDENKRSRSSSSCTSSSGSDADNTAAAVATASSNNKKPKLEPRGHHVGAIDLTTTTTVATTITPIKRDEDDWRGTIGGGCGVGGPPRCCFYSVEPPPTPFLMAATPGRTYVSIPSRPSVFHDKNFWWMVDLNFHPGHSSSSSTTATPPQPPPQQQQQGATPLVMSCMNKYGWTEGHARRVLQGYKQFLALVTAKSDCHSDNRDFVLEQPPGDITQTYYPCSTDVDLMWQEHILDTTNYLHDCLFLCGRFIGRSRDSANSHSQENKEERDETVRMELKAMFGNQFDKELWTNHKVTAATVVAPNEAVGADNPTPSMPDAAQTETASVTEQEPTGSKSATAMIVPNTPGSSCSVATPPPKPKAVMVNLRVKDATIDPNNNDKDDEEEQSEFYFVMSRSKTMARLLKSVAQAKKMELSQLRFLIYGGRYVVPDDTPLTLGLKDNDEITLVRSNHDGEQQAK